MTTNRGPHPVAGYETFFGFHEPPFGLAPNPRFRFESASHEAALSQLTYAVERREPVVVVTGDIGTGKTLLCRTVIERLDRKTFLSIVNDPRMGRDDLLKQMLQDFGVVSKHRAETVSVSRADLVHALDEFLLSLVPLGAHAVAIVDEAQHAPPDLLEEVRLLSNIQDDRSTMLQIILVGQPDLEVLLGTRELESLRQRITRRVRLEPLAPDEVSKYVAHRMSIAREGQTQSRLLGATELERALAEWHGSAPSDGFTADALARVAQISRGIPRVVNLLCDRALETAFAAHSRTVDATVVDAAARLLELPAPGAAEPQQPQREPEAASLDAALDEPFIAPPGPLAATAGDVGSRPSRRVSSIVAAGLIVAAAAFGARAWMNARSGRTGNAPPPATTRPLVEPSSPAQPPTPAAVPPPTPAAPTTSATQAPRAPAATAPAQGTFEIVVASFRTTTRANEVAGEVSALGEPVRQAEAAGWQQVFAGPYASRSDAEQAQQRLLQAGFSGTIVQERR